MHFCLFAAEASSSSEIPPARQTLTSTAGTTKGITLDHASQVLRGFSQENFYESPLFVKLRNWVLGKNRALPILLSKRWTGSPSPSGLFRGDRDSPICNDHFDTNVRVKAFSVQRPWYRKIIERQFGRIIFISSQSGLVGIPGQPVYCASKGAIINLVRSLGVEWAKYGITVNSVAPTFAETDLTRKRLQDPTFRTFVLGKIPKGELALPEEIGQAVVYLASNEAGTVNCTTLC